MRTKALILLACVLVLAGLAGCADTSKVVMVKQEGGVDTTTLQILHLSDLHVGKSETVERDNLKIIVAKTIEKWGKDENKPVVLITGDISNDGEVNQFDQAREILDPLYKSGFRLLVIPGNHDYGPIGSLVEINRFKNFKKKFYPKNPEVTFPLPLEEINGHVLVGLNSMEGQTRGIDKTFADGDLGDRQTRKLDEILKGLENRKSEHKVIVYLHHHPFLYPRRCPLFACIYERYGHWLDDGEEFMKVISNRVDILLFGHEHWHIDFSGTDLSTKYGIPVILSAGMSTNEKQTEYAVNQEGIRKRVLNKGLLGRLITIQDDGATKVENIKFDR